MVGIAKKFMTNGENMMKLLEQLMGRWSIPIGVSLECHLTLSGLTCRTSYVLPAMGPCLLCWIYQEGPQKHLQSEIWSTFPLCPVQLPP